MICIKKEINVIVGENIRFYRESFGYTREKLSELIDVSPRFLYDTEMGRVGVSITTLKKLCEVLGISADRLLWSREEKISQDESRTACHNSLIVKFNMLARYLKMQGREAAWRDELGYEEDDRYYRKRIGDFGCFIAFINGINAR